MNENLARTVIFYDAHLNIFVKFRAWHPHFQGKTKAGRRYTSHEASENSKNLVPHQFFRQSCEKENMN